MKTRRFRLCLLLLLWLSFASTPLAQGSASSIRDRHIVAQGENLFRIALQYNLFAEDVARANGLTADANIMLGQQLIIPNFLALPQAAHNHIVGAGETLHSIATAYGLSVDQLQTLNDLPDDGEATPGQSLVIVPGAALNGGAAQTTTEASPTSVEAAVDPASLIIGGADFVYAHIVEAGDTVSEIGFRFDMSVTALAQANNLADPGRISVGQKLIIPGIDAPRLLYPLPELATKFSLEPVILETGHSARVEIETGERAVVSGSFLDRPLRVLSNDDGARHTILIAVPIFIKRGRYPLRLELVTDSGARHQIEAELQVISGARGFQHITIGDTRLLAPEIEMAEIDRLQALTAGYSPQQRWRSPLILPSGGKVNAWYGLLRSYNGGAYDRYHLGVDFAAGTGAPVLAAADGTVVAAEALQIRGNTVVIDHGLGLFTLYAHLHDMAVKPGDSVLSGQFIGGIGNSGRSTGPHLHWEVWLHGVSVDPMQWVKERFP